tara:strand:+ start:1035 stop:1523 length:489 start_codon:yes stop_codon:yes gene_type:complete
MKKLALFAVACCFTAFSFAQDQGQWSFGAGGNFTAPDADANIGYFAMDGLLLSFNFNMSMDYQSEHVDDTGMTTGYHDHEGDFDWGASLRYYAVDNMFVEAGMSTGTGEDPDTYLCGGVSLPLGFDDKLWMEPMIRFDMPGEEYGIESQNNLGLAWAFRYTF